MQSTPRNLIRGALFVGEAGVEAYAVFIHLA